MHKSFEQGLALSKAGETKKAMLEFRNAIQIDPKFVDARFELGTCLLKLRNFEAALGELKKVEETDPTRPQLKQRLAEALVGAAKNAEGRELCVALLKEESDNALLHEYLSRALLGLSQERSDKPPQEVEITVQDYLTEAKKEAERAIQLDPSLVETHLTLGHILILKNRSDAVPKPLTEAVTNEVNEHFEAAKKARPDDKAMRLRIAGLWALADDKAKAMMEVEALLSESPADVDARIMKAEFLFDANKIDESSALLDSMYAEKLGGRRMDFLNGRILFSRGDYEKARDEFKKVKNSATGAYFLARALEKIGDRQHALTELQTVVKAEPTFEGARSALFDMYMDDGNVPMDNLQAEEAVRLLPQKPLGYLLRARVSSVQRDWAKAHESLDDALHCVPGLFDALLLRADLYMKEGNLDQGRAAIEEIIKAKPENAIGYLLRCQMHLGLKEFNEAEADAEKAVALAPQDPNAGMTLATVRTVKGDFEKACAAYEAVLAVAPGNASARFGLAGLYTTHKEYAKAVDLLMSIPKDDPLYVRARTQIAELYDGMGNMDAAMQQYQELLLEHPEAADAALGLFQHLARSQDLTNMEDLAKTTLLRDPESVLGHLMLSDVHSARGSWIAATEEMRAALQKQPNSARLWFRLGALNAKASRVNAALEALRRARELQPDFDAAQLGEAKMLARLGKAQDALELCNAVLDKKPDDESASLALADIKADLGQDPEAESMYRHITSLHPSSLVPYLHMASLHEKNKRNTQAAETYESAIAAAPNIAALHVEYGRFWERSGTQERARQEYLRALDLSPNDPQIQDMLTRVSVESGDYADAEQRLRAKLAQAPDNVTARLNLALVLEKQGKSDEATKSLFDFVIASKDPEAIGMEMSKLFATKGQYDRIERLAKSLLETDATKWTAHYALGVARAGQGDFEGALDHFSEADRLNPGIPLAKHAEGLTYVRMNKLDEALTAFQSARQTDTHFIPAYMDAALIYLRRGEFTAVEDLCRIALEAEPTANDPILVRAAAYAYSNRVDMALRTINDLLERDATQAVSASAIADVLSQRGRGDDAIALCNRCRAAAPDVPAIVMRLGTVYQRAGKLDEALTEYTRLVNLTPNSAMALNNLAWLLCELKNYDEALLQAQRARTIQPEHPVVLDTLGWIYLKKGDLERSIPLLEASSRGASNDPRMLYHLGKAYIQAGRLEDARPALKQAITFAPNSPEAQDAQKSLDTIGTGPKLSL